MTPWILNAGEGWAEKYEPEPNTVCVSITEPIHPGNILKRQEPARLKKGFVDVLRLEFQDYDPVRKLPGSKFISAQVEIPEDAALFTQKQAAKTARFLRKHRGKNIVVHCAAGVSRSAGIVEATLEAFPEYEDKGWMRHPNNHVKTLMKRAFGLVPIGADPTPGEKEAWDWFRKSRSEQPDLPLGHEFWRSSLTTEDRCQMIVGDTSGDPEDIYDECGQPESAHHEYEMIRPGAIAPEKE